jgi:uncharacterized protein YdaU (DUF1376 family)
MSTSPLLDAALNYARRGWWVFPVHRPSSPGCSCRNPNCERIGKHPRIKAWGNLATTNEVAINKWWGEWPDANVAILTGTKSGLLVLDVDNKNGKDGDATLDALCRRYDWHPQTFTVKTASGRHFYFAHPNGTIHSGTSALGPGLDVQGNGQYVITPPSLHESGCLYECLDSETPVANVPEPILALIRPLHANPRVAEGRNNELTSIAGRERRAGATESDIVNHLLEENHLRYDEPLPDDEVRRIARSVARYAPAAPNLYWMPWYMSDWFESLVVRTGEACERGMYASLLIESWRRKGVLPNDPAQLWRLAQADSPEQFKDAQDFVLSEFLPGELDGKPVLVHPRITQLWAQQAKAYAQKVEAGRKSGASRRSRERNNSSPSGT